MKALEFEQYGPSSVLRIVDRPIPNPQAYEVQVAVAAAGVNPADWRLRSGQFKYGMRLKLPFVPGNDLSGIVSAVGAGVTDFQIGDSVFAMTPLKSGGACAKYACVSSDLVSRAPQSIPLEDAASIPLAGLTALQGIRDHGKLCCGQRLLVVGGAGGVGHFAIQLGNAFGAKVSSLSSASNFNFCRERGAIEVLDYRDQDIYSGPSRFDLIFDTVAVESFTRWKHLLKPSGTLVTVNPIIGKILPRLITAWFGVSQLKSYFVRPSGSDLLFLADLIDKHRLKPEIEKRFPLEEASFAHDRSQSSRVRGKLLIEMRRSVEGSVSAHD